MRYKNRFILLKIRKEQHRKKKLIAVINKYRNNPVEFAEDFLGINLFEYQKVMLNSIGKYKYRRRNYGS